MKSILVGEHPTIEKIRELISLMADTGFSVLLQGETGTGKEVVARLLHQTSSRHKKPFVKVNCAALPVTLLESELFGYERGAFTGADKPKPGKFELASGGSIFLDEIGEISMTLQTKLLQVLQSGDYTRLGGIKDVQTNAWVIASTNQNLTKRIGEGLFRKDLYYRLNIIRVEMPPLRERKEDIPLLIEHFVKMHSKRIQLDKEVKIRSDLKDLFQGYHWPGNVRELSNILMRLMLGEEPDIVKAHLLNTMEADGLNPERGHLHGDYPEGIPEDGNETGQKSRLTLKEVKREATKNIEKRVILHALQSSGWNKRRAAKLMKISYKALFYKMDQYEIRNKHKMGFQEETK